MSTLVDLCTDHKGSCVCDSSCAGNASSFSYQSGETLNNLVLPFTSDELSYYVENRSIGLTDKSRYWVKRSAEAFWRATLGAISRQGMERLRVETLTRYSSPWNQGKMLAFAKAFLKYLTKTRLDTRYAAFEVFLEMPKAVKARKAVTSRIIPQADIENVLAYIRRAEAAGEILRDQASHYVGVIIFGAYTGQRSMSTMSRLTVGQFREALAHDKPVLQVEAKQDKIRMEHYVPLHPHVVKAIRQLLDGREDTELMFRHESFWRWLTRQKIPMTRFRGHFALGDLRKFAEQHGDIIGWDPSNRAYILTHGVSGVDWTHYKHPPPEHVYDIYMKSWADVSF